MDSFLLIAINSEEKTSPRSENLQSANSHVTTLLVSYKSFTRAINNNEAINPNEATMDHLIPVNCSTTKNLNRLIHKEFLIASEPTIKWLKRWYNKENITLMKRSRFFDHFFIYWKIFLMAIIRMFFTG